MPSKLPGPGARADARNRATLFDRAGKARHRLITAAHIAFIVACLAGMVLIWLGPARHVRGAVPPCWQPGPSRVVTLDGARLTVRAGACVDAPACSPPEMHYPDPCRAGRRP